MQLEREKLELHKQAMCVLQENELAHTCCAEASMQLCLLTTRQHLQLHKKLPTNVPVTDIIVMRTIIKQHSLTVNDAYEVLTVIYVHSLSLPEPHTSMVLVPTTLCLLVWLAFWALRAPSCFAKQIVVLTQLRLRLSAQVDCQDVTNSAKLTAQRQAVQSEQAELIVDLQHRLQHLANVNARYDD